MTKQFEEIVLYEIRENRKAINKLQVQVFSNKIKLGVFITSITILLNLVFLLLVEKIKTFI